MNLEEQIKDQGRQAMEFLSDNQYHPPINDLIEDFLLRIAAEIQAQNNASLFVNNEQT